VKVLRPQAGRAHAVSVWPRTTAQYKGDRSLSGPYEESAGHIVPLEGMGQHNPARWEGALLQLTEFDAVEEVLIAYG
jgi:hypothetical protein